MSASTSPFAGRHALVTGASRGLGEAIACQLACDGARVALVGRDDEALARVASAIRDDGGTADVRVVDVTDREAAARVVVDQVAAHGPIHLLVTEDYLSLSRFYEP